MIIPSWIATFCSYSCSPSPMAHLPHKKWNKSLYNKPDCISPYHKNSLFLITLLINKFLAYG